MSDTDSDNSQVADLTNIQVNNANDTINDICTITLKIDNKTSHLDIPICELLKISIATNNSLLFGHIVRLINNLNEVRVNDMPLLEYIVIILRKNNSSSSSMLESLSDCNIDFDICISGRHILKYIVDGFGGSIRKQLLEFLMSKGVSPHKRTTDYTSAYDTVMGLGNRSLIEFMCINAIDRPEKRRRLHHLVLAYDNTCPICKNVMDIKESMVTNCLHAFHVSCLNDNKRCPMCREEL